jgi:hypothetical protein
MFYIVCLLHGSVDDHAIGLLKAVLNSIRIVLSGSLVAAKTDNESDSMQKNNTNGLARIARNLEISRIIELALQ